MKLYLTNTLILFVGFFFLISCDENFLATQPTDRITDEVFWEKETDAEHAVNAIYNRIPGLYYLWLDATSDNAVAGRSTSLAFAFGNGTQTSQTPWAEDYWQRSYEGIQRSNNLLENIDRVPNLTDELKNRFIGEAKFLRAFFYNDLINLYGDVPLVTTTLSIADGNVSRDPKQEIYDFIISDLESVVDYLPISYSSSSNTGRVTRGAVLALISRVHLWQNNFIMAKEAAEKVMNLGEYELYHDYAELFTYEAQNNSEIIFDQQFIPNDFNHNVSRLLSPRSSAGGSFIAPLKSLVDAYEDIEGMTIEESLIYDPMSPYENRDPRLQETILTPGSAWNDGIFVTRPGSGSTDEIGVNVNTSFSGLNFRKYVNKEDRDQNNNNGSVNLIMIRYADILLTYAESKIETDDIDQSVYDAINEIRLRAGMPEIEDGKTIEELREIVRRERRVELALEGMRPFDIKRWGIIEEVQNEAAYGKIYVEDGELQTVFVENRTFNPDRDYLWPIPSREIFVNPNLTQNPGY